MEVYYTKVGQNDLMYWFSVPFFLRKDFRTIVYSIFGLVIWGTMTSLEGFWVSFDDWLVKMLNALKVIQDSIVPFQLNKVKLNKKGKPNS